MPHKKENYRPLFLINKTGKSCQQNGTNGIRQPMKTSYTMIKWDLYQGHNGGLASANLSIWHATLTKD